MKANYETSNIKLYNADNMEIMAQFPDKYFDLAIVDPPYGINFAETIEKNTWNKKLKEKHTAKKWDKDIPNEEYFKELFRVSKNQIIWGGNYFLEFLPSSPCFLIWFKSTNFTGADCELAWTSFKSPIRSLNLSRVVAHTSEVKIHPTQKNIKIYEWIIRNYANQNDKVLDTHLGSGSITIAIDKANTLDKKNLTFVGIELDPDYFNASVKRFENYKRQYTIF